LVLAKAGAQVLVHYGCGAKEAEAVVAQIRKAGSRADAIAAPDSPQKLANRSEPSWATVSTSLWRMHGSRKQRPLRKRRSKTFDKLFAVNVRGPFFLVQQLLPILSKGSSILFVSLLATRAVVGTIPAYAATKGAIDTMVKHFASLLGERLIRVNAVAPGVVATETSNFTKTDAGRDFRIRHAGVQTPSQPDDIGGVVAFLASDAARWITGDTINVDGGSKL
jgi:3-oxoacyl-[acyl-carrier protein] reductase